MAVLRVGVLALTLVGFVLLTGCSAPQQIIPDGPGLNGSPISGGKSLEGVGGGLSDKLLPTAPVQRILAIAYSKTGLPYRSGGTSPETGFDCSGFSQWVFAQNGISLPRTPAAQLNTGLPVEKDEIQPGDLVFYKAGYLHVGIYTGDGKFIHSPHTGDRVKESAAFDRYHSQHFAGARRIVSAPDAAPLDQKIKEAIVAKALLAHGRSEPAKIEKTAAAQQQVKTEKTAAKRNEPAKAKSRPSKASATHYVVREGDTIWNVARSLGISKSDLLRANGLKENHVLRIGQKLTVPNS